MNAIMHASNVIRFEGRQATVGFTCRDLMEIQEWDGGDRRIEVDPSVDSNGQFAMIYEGEAPWASWAISRQGSRILVWDCVTLADVGWFGGMRQALAAVPGGPTAPEPTAKPQAEVIPFRPFLARRSAA
jgi:hypothetical protein